MYKWRDQIKIMNKTDLKSFLKWNSQNSELTEDKLLDAAADILTFGAIVPCDKCKGQYVFGREGYTCTGDLTEWVKCMQQLKEPPRVPCDIPRSLVGRKTYTFFADYVPKVVNRAFKNIEASVPNTVVKKEEGEG